MEKASFIQPTRDRARGRPRTKFRSQPKPLTAYLLRLLLPRIQVHVESLARIGANRKEAFELKRLVCCVKATWSEDGGQTGESVGKSLSTLRSTYPPPQNRSDGRSCGGDAIAQQLLAMGQGLLIPIAPS